MFTMADIIEGETGNLLVAIPERVPAHGRLDLRLRGGGYDIEADGLVIGRVRDVADETMALLAGRELVGLIECPPDMTLPDAITLFASVRDERHA